MQNNRLISIDVLRGFDMLMIIFADRFFYSLNEGVQSNFTSVLANQFSHPEWFGFHFYDIIMPLFLFVVGVVIPFSMERRVQETGNKSRLYPHLIRRFIILFILGWIVQGNLLDLDINKFQIFSNTLQAIAVGYFFSCVAYIHLSKKARYVLFASCLILYALLLEFVHVPGIGTSELLPDKNIALYIDHYVFGRFDDGYQYTWLLSGLGFIATTLSGLFAGEMLRSKSPRKKIAMNLVLIGTAAVILGLILNIWHPIVKKIWDSSFVLFSSGICFLLLALFYWIIDIKGYTNWGLPLRIIGVNAITAYVLSHIIDFSQLAKQVLFGFQQYLGNYYDAFTTIGGFGILYLLLWYMNKNKTYIKI
ncbi:acyltransferase family protein [Flavobacteriaceae bacterium LMO-SS05]